MIALLIALGALNPAVTQANIHDTICVRGWTATQRPPAYWAADTKRRMLRGFADRDPRHYQLDHIVPLEVGGAPRARANLQIQPLDLAHRKDRLENEVRAAVCSGALSLELGQSIFQRPP